MKRQCPHCGGVFPRWGLTLDCPLCGEPLVTDAFRSAVPLVRVLAGIVLVALVGGFLAWLVWVIVGG